MRRTVFRIALLSLGLVIGVLLTGVGWVRFGLSDGQRGILASDILTRLLPGQFNIASLAWEGAGGLRLRGVRIADPEGQVVATGAALGGTFVWLPLLQGRVVFDHIRVVQAWVQVDEMPNAGPMRIERAFVLVSPADPNAPAPPPKLDGLRIELHDVTVHSADLRVAVGDVQVHATALDIRDADYWVRGDSMGLTVELNCDLALRTGTLVNQTRALHVKGRNIVYVTAHRYDDVRAERLDVEWAEGRVGLEGSLFVREGEVKDDDARAWFAVETQQHLLSRVVPRDVRGFAEGHLALRKAADMQRLSLTLSGKHLAWRHIAIDRLQAQGGFKANEMAVDAFDVSSQSASLNVQGVLAWLPGGHLGRHRIKIEGNQVPVQRLLGPFVDHPGFLPEKVNFTATSAGRSLWPMTAELRWDAMAWGVPASWLPGIPDPLVLRGVAQMHPDMVEFLRLQLGSRDHQMALQGSLPLEHLGVVDVISNLHRIPEQRIVQAED